MASNWDKERVLQAIRRCHQQGLSLTTVWRHDKSLYHASWRHFGGWHQAIAAADITPPQRKWTKRRVLKAIRDRHRRGLSLWSVCREDSLLYAAAYRYFGGWPKALDAAGIVLPNRWTRDRVLSEMRARYDALGSIRGIWQNKRLATAAFRRFGSRHAALVAAGIIPVDTPRRCSLSRQGVIHAILARHRQGRTLTVDANVDLVDRARRLFGTWNGALEAAGLTPRHRFTRWPCERVIEAIQALGRHGQFEDSSTKIVDKSLQSAARRRFGTLRAALVAAGVLAPDETVRRKRKWTRRSVIEMLQDRRMQGLPLDFETDPRLAKAAWQRFGSWQRALDAAGLRREAGR